MVLKEYFRYCDAYGRGNWKESTGPSYYGNIAREFRNGLHMKPAVQFTPIPGKVKIYDVNFVSTLNNDGRYLLEISHAVQNGIVPMSLIMKLIGHIHSARYLVLSQWVDIFSEVVFMFLLMHVNPLNIGFSFLYV